MKHINDDLEDVGEHMMMLVIVVVIVAAYMVLFGVGASIYWLMS